MSHTAISPASGPLRWVALGALLGGLSVAAGAIGAHALEPRFEDQYAGRVYTKFRPDRSVARVVPLGQKRLTDFQTGAQYQMYHALAIMAAGLGALLRPSRGWPLAASLFLLGICGFSGGLYGLAIADLPVLGATIVPLGGVLFVAGWTVLAATAFWNAAA